MNLTWRGELFLELETLFLCTLVDIGFKKWTIFLKFEELKSAKQLFPRIKLEAHCAASCDCNFFCSHPDNGKKFITELVVRSAKVVLHLLTVE